MFLLLSCLTIIVGIFTIYFLGYNNIAFFVLGIIIVLDIVLLLFNDIKIKYRLLDKKAIIYADICNSKFIKLLYGKDKDVFNKVYNILLSHVDNGCVKKIYSNHYVILTEYHSKNDLISMVNKINDEVNDIIDDELFILSMKFGIQICNDEDFETNENKAALACNTAKMEPLTTYVFYDDEDIEKKINEKKVIDNLVNALKNNEFEVYFQPKYDHKLKKVVGSEALVRLIQDGHVVSASEFIDVAEKYGFTSLLDKYVLKEVCKKIKELKKNKLEFNTISINVSRNTLCEKSMIDFYSGMLDKYGVKKDEIELEITERDPNNSNYKMHNIIHELCKKFRVSVDDFGIGNSSLSMLNENKINTIKIDRKFVIDDSEYGRKILDSIIKLAHDLGFSLVAEGVETEEQYNYLKSKKCNVIQGFYYYKPLPFDEYKKLLMEEE